VAQRSQEHIAAATPISVLTLRVGLESGGDRLRTPTFAAPDAAARDALPSRAGGARTRAAAFDRDQTSLGVDDDIGIASWCGLKRTALLR
jgi:hypothetical protein